MLAEIIFYNLVNAFVLYSQFLNAKKEIKTK